jgi:hypothetical protein
MTITEFLTARYDEAEAAARAAMDVEPAYAHYGGTAAEAFLALAVSEGETEEAAAHFERWRPEHVLADIAAKRAILALHTCQCPDPDCRDCGECSGAHHADPTPAPCGTVKVLAQPHAEHPDFDPAWKVA